MKKFLLFLFMTIPLISGCQKKEKLEDDKVYFFYQTTCPHCHIALEDINRIAPDLELYMYEISGSGRELFIQCVEKFDLPRNQIGTPLICMGNSYIMGWSGEEAIKFADYVDKLKK